MAKQIVLEDFKLSASWDQNIVGPEASLQEQHGKGPFDAAPLGGTVVIINKHKKRIRLATHYFQLTRKSA